MDQEIPVGFRSIKLLFDLQTDTSETKVAALIDATEKFCVVLQTLRAPLSLVVTARAYLAVVPMDVVIV